MRKRLPIIAITMGDPAGIGPEIIVKVLRDKGIYRLCNPLIVGDGQVISKAAVLLGGGIDIERVECVEKAGFSPGKASVVSLSEIDEVRFGYPCNLWGEYQIDYVIKALEMARDGKVDSMVTAPINKSIINRARYPFPGHTELLASITGTEKFAMMFVGRHFKVSLVTIHHPLRDIPSLLDEEKVFTTISLTHKALVELFGISDPKIAVAALNPHAGENGIFGEEEREIIMPAIKRGIHKGIRIFGPFPADSLFFQAKNEGYDAIIAMYHDQGLIGLKLLDFQHSCQLTLGLPIIRTSVDHGVAYDIAGKGIASPLSLISAIKLASRLSRKRIS